VRQGLLPLIDAAFHPGDAGLSRIRRLGIGLGAVAAYWAYVRGFEKRAVLELHLRPLPLLLGATGGCLLVGPPMAGLFALDAYAWTTYRGFSPDLLGVAGLIALAGLLEELVYRGLLFRVLERYYGTRAALAIQAVIFALQHLANLEQGNPREALTLLVSVALLGLLWAGIFVLTRNLWVVAAHHAAWNFTILLSGVPLSGIDDWRTLAPLESHSTGPDWLTGGQFGPESSWVVIGVIACAGVLLLKSSHSRGAFRLPQGG
jgi:membrane protease YdiL (CAAX protease family)